MSTRQIAQSSHTITDANIGRIQLEFTDENHEPISFCMRDVEDEIFSVVLTLKRPYMFGGLK